MPPDAELSVTRGALVLADAEVAVVVMAINSDPRVPEAVASLRAQDARMEIVVVNTGGGSLASALATELASVVLVEGPALSLPGRTRNLGIANSTAPVVAFLAADCLATPGWIANRLAHHGRSTAVASALRPAPDASGHVRLSVWASYALLHSRRAPEYPADGVARYGASYARELFDRFGLFREDLRIAEDSEFNARLDGVGWAPDVITLHRYPETLSLAVRDAFVRGWALQNFHRGRRRFPLYASLRRTVGHVQMAWRLAWYAKGDTGAAIRRSAPFILILGCAYASGAAAAWLGSWGGR